jgi:hypothetical protein
MADAKIVTPAKTTLNPSANVGKGWTSQASTEWKNANARKPDIKTDAIKQDAIKIDVKTTATKK